MNFFIEALDLIEKKSKTLHLKTLKKQAAPKLNGYFFQKIQYQITH
jgi:hypothetical protein